MKIKRFTAANMQAGLKAIGEALGPEAVILSNRRLSTGLEIVAGVDEAELDRFLATRPAPSATSDIIKAKTNQAESLDQATMQELFSVMADKNQQAFNRSASKPASAPASSRRMPLQEPARARTASVREDTPKPAQRSDRAPSFDATMVSDLRREIDSLKILLREQTEQLREPPAPVAAITPQYERLESRLTTLGFSAGLSKKLLAYYDREDSLDSNWRLIMNRVASALPTPLYDPIARGGRFVLLGPTGAGKTTTIAKMAALATKEYGEQDVALVSLDWFQVGGQEILRSVAEILGVAFYPLTEQSSLPAVLRKLASKRLVLIDTSGSTQALQHWNRLRATDPAIARLAMLMVMPATMHAASIKQFIGQLEQPDFAGTILSKLDESVCFGGILEPLLKHRWPLWYCTAGQSIPQDIEPADARVLVRRLVKGLTTEVVPSLASAS